MVSEVDAAEAREAGVLPLLPRRCRASEWQHRPDSSSRRITPSRPTGDQLESVAKYTKDMPREWINDEGNDIVGDEFLPYIATIRRPLPAIAQLQLKPIALPE